MFILLILSVRVIVLCRGGYFNIQVEMFSDALSDQKKKKSLVSVWGIPIQNRGVH